MRGRHNLDLASSEIKAAIAASLDHAGELLTDVVRSKMSHCYEQPSLRRGSPSLNFIKHASRYDITSCAFCRRVMVLHEALAIAIQEMASGAAQSFFQNRSGHAGMGSCKHTGRVKLNHFQITKRQPVAQSHRQAVTSLVAGRSMIFIHGRAGTGREQHRMGSDQAILACTNIQTQRRGNP